MNLSEDQLGELDRFIEAKTIISHMEKVAKDAEKPLKEEFLLYFTDCLWTNKAVPENPRITTTIEGDDNNSALFQMRNVFHPERNLPPAKNRDPNKSTKIHLTEKLQEIGFDPKRATKIIRDNIRICPSFSLKYSASPELIEKWMNVLFATSKAKMTTMGFFSTEERLELFGEPTEAILVIEPDKLFHRILTVVHNLEELRALVRFFSPEISISNLKFAISARLDETPKLDAARRLIGDN